MSIVRLEVHDVKNLRLWWSGSVRQHLVVRFPQTAKNLVESNVALEELFAEPAAPSRCSDPYSVPKLKMDVAMAETVPTGVDTLLLLNP